jgi:hypothetical protein
MAVDQATPHALGFDLLDARLGGQPPEHRDDDHRENVTTAS